MSQIEPNSEAVGAIREAEELLSPEFLRKIERLSLVSSRVFAGRTRGERRAQGRGASVEFADYRNYSTGDDFRRVDWNVYARLEKLFLKLFVLEEDLHVYILIDSSASMGFGSPSKLLYAKRVAAALSYIALCNYDRVGICTMQDGGFTQLRPKRGKQSAFSIFEHLSTIKAGGGTALAESMRQISLRNQNPGLAIVLSDFFDPNYRKSLASLAARKFDVMMLQILDEEEVNPTLLGDLTLVDSETKEKCEVSITRSLLKKYKKQLEAFMSGLKELASANGFTYMQVSTATPFEDLVLNYMRRRGSLK